MRILLTILALTISFSAVRSQTMVEEDKSRPETSLLATFLSEASMLSLKLEKAIINGQNIFLTASAGAGYNTEVQVCLAGPCETNPRDFLTLPHHVSLCIGKGSHYLEAGIGGSLIIGNTDQHYIPYPLVGYRLHPKSAGKLLLRLFFSYPLVSEMQDIAYFPYGLSIGMSF
ncbi:MAG: hypothetical protein IH591_14655 [Bacteroidales bacterium]|nr:hypothetical protein [Bacteroidales bacterium]